MNLRGVDLNLLTVFEVVYEEGNQQRAAERLAMTQPAVSSAMSRLRDAIRDELFVPGPRGVTPTPAADRLFTRIRPALEIVRDGFRSGLEFDPKKVSRTFRVATGYASGALGEVGQLLGWLRAEAPGVRLIVEAIEEPRELPRRLRIGAVDFLVDYARYDDDDLHHEVVLDQELVVIARKGHPRIQGRITKKQFNEERHVAYLQKHEPEQVPQLGESVAGLTYRVDVELGNALAMPFVVRQTDLIAVTTRRIAHFFTKPFDIQIIELPFRTPAIPIYLIWHRSREHDAGHAWLRRGLKDIINRGST